MAVRLTLLAAPLLGVTLVLLALLPPSSHVASSALTAPKATTPAPSTPRPLPCSIKGEGETRGKRDTVGCTMATAKGPNSEEELPRMSKRAAPAGLGSFSEDKRAPSSGFFGMRGKKGADDEPESFKRAPNSGFFGMRGKKADSEDGPSEDSAGEGFVEEEDLESAAKRAPNSGFFGMRGKKLPVLGYAPWYRDPKRARMGFFGTRGKKSDYDGDDVADMETDKRAPSMGFFGSRGKKDDNGLGDEEEVYGWTPLELETVLADKRAHQMGFFGMRGKKSDSSEAETDVAKRAPMGFFGMRGKKASSEENYDEAFSDLGSKRAPMGFFGMRGKKDDVWSEGTDGQEGEKRAHQMGFFGMRGKKADGGEFSGYPEEEKRAQQMGFFGMRGKKADDEEVPQEWLLYPEAKRGAGAAAAAAWPTSVSRTSHTLNSLLAYLAGREAEGIGHPGSGWRPVRKRFRGNKKAPSGFFGMRGKKSRADMLSMEVWPPSTNLSGEREHEATEEAGASQPQGGGEERAFEEQTSSQ